MALLRNPAAPFLTICAYANLKSQIFLTSSDAWSRNSQSKSSSASLFSLFLISKLKSRPCQFFPPNIPRTCQFLPMSTAATPARGLGTPGPGYRTTSRLSPQQPLPVPPPRCRSDFHPATTGFSSLLSQCLLTRRASSWWIISSPLPDIRGPSSGLG